MKTDRPTSIYHFPNKAEECFAAMVRHDAKTKTSGPLTESGGAGSIPPDLDAETAAGDPEMAWGAYEVAAVMMGVSKDPDVNRARRRRVFCLYSKFKEERAEAMARKRPLPPNPLGWVIVPGCNRIIMHVPTFRALITSQLSGGRDGKNV